MTSRYSSGISEISRARTLLALVLALVVRMLSRTFRVSLVGPEPPSDRPRIYVFLHGHQLALLRYPRTRDVTVLTSMSSDGALQTVILGRLGFRIVRGSSSRGGASGLLGLVRALRSGSEAALAVDGPRGPRGKVKPGAFFLAQAARAVIVPVVCAASWALPLVRSWDRFLVPLPFCRVVLLRGDPIEVPRPRGRGIDIADLQRRVEGELESLTHTAQRLLSG